MKKSNRWEQDLEESCNEWKEGKCVCHVQARSNQNHSDPCFWVRPDRRKKAPKGCKVKKSNWRGEGFGPRWGTTVTDFDLCSATLARVPMRGNAEYPQWQNHPLISPTWTVVASSATWTVYPPQRWHDGGTRFRSMVFVTMRDVPKRKIENWKR